MLVTFQWNTGKPPDGQWLLLWVLTENGDECTSAFFEGGTNGPAFESQPTRAPHVPASKRARIASRK